MSILDSKILVIDDYPTMIRIIKKFLEDFGFKNIDTAENGEDAWGMIQEKPYDLIISDWNMEPITGLELLERVRGDDKVKETPFIMVTAESKPANVIEAKKKGVSNYIVKPFKAHTIKSKIESVLGHIS